MRLLSLPSGLCQLAALKTLNVASNRLSALPPDLHRLGGLDTVLLAANDFGSHLSAALACRTLWIDAGLTCGPALSCARRIAHHHPGALNKIDIPPFRT